MEFIIAVIGCLALVTVVGHVLWVIAATILRAIFQQGPAASSLPPTSVEATDLAATVRHLDRLAARGILSKEAHEQLLKVVRGETRELPPAMTTMTRPVSPAEAIAASRPEPSLAPLANEASVPLGGAVAAAVGASATAAETPVDAQVVDAEIIEPVRPSVRTIPGTARPTSQHPLDRPDGPVRPVEPRRTWAILTQAFMEERNIHWGEIISGLLIVICSVGLVVSLWATLRDSIPYLPALIFMLGTAAFQGAGQYALHKWKLHSVSRAVLIIAMLLIPLNFLAAIALASRDDELQRSTDLSYWIAITVGLSVYGALAYFASRSLLRESWWWLTLAVIGPSAGQLIVNRGYRAEASGWLMAWVLAVPLVSFVLATAGPIMRARHWRSLSLNRATPLFLILGIAVFSVAAPIALLISKSASIREMLGTLSPAISLIGVMSLGTGLLVHHRTRAKKLATLRTAGTAISIAGGFVLLLAVLFAWPHPSLLVTVSLVNTVAPIATALLAELPVLHVGAVACAALGWVIGFHLLRGNYAEPPISSRQVVQTILSGETAVMLAVLSGVVAAAGSGLMRAKRCADGLNYLLGSAGVAAASTMIALFVGFAGGLARDWATPVLLLYSAGLIAAARLTAAARDVFQRPGLPRIQTSAMAHGGAVLLLLALVQGLRFNETLRGGLDALGWLPRRPILSACLLHSLLCAVVAVGAGRRLVWRDASARQSAHWRSLVEPLQWSSLIVSTLAAPWVLWTTGGHYAEHALYAGIIAAVWMLAAVVQIWPIAWSVFQAACAVTISFAVAALCQRQPWWNDELLDLRHVAWQLAALGLWALPWPLLRMATDRQSSWHALLSGVRPAVDQVFLGIGIGCWLLFACCGVAAGVVSELGLLKQVADRAIDSHPVVYGSIGWLAWLVILAAVIVAVREKATVIGVAGMMLTVASAALLVAGPYESQVASASALRWSCALCGALFLVPFCLRKQLWLKTSRWWIQPDSFTDKSVIDLEILATVLTGLPVFLLTTVTVYMVASGGMLGGPQAASVFARMGSTNSYAIPLAIVTGTLLAYAVRERRAAFAGLGSFVFQYLASLACLLPVLSRGETLEGATWILLLQWNALALGIYSLIWLSLRNRIETKGAVNFDEKIADLLGLDELEGSLSVVSVQVLLAVLAVLVLAAWGAALIIAAPGVLTPTISQFGHWFSYLAIALAVLAVGWCFRSRLRDWSPHLIAGSAFCLTVFLAASFSWYNSVATWLNFHILQAGWTGIAVLMTGALIARPGRVGTPPQPLRGWVLRGAGWALATAGLVVVLSLRGAGADPTGPWWSAATTGCIALASGTAAVTLRLQKLAYAATLLIGLCVVYVWDGLQSSPIPPDGWALMHWLILSTALASGVWLLAELHFQYHQQQPLQPGGGLLPAHRFFGAAALLIWAATVFGGATIASIGRLFTPAVTLDPNYYWQVGSTQAVGLVLAGTLWDRAARNVMPGLYLWGLIAMLVVINAFQLKLDRFVFAVVVAVSAYVALTGVMWLRGVRLAAWGQWVGIADPVAGLRRTSGWLPVVNCVLAWLSAGVALLLVLTFEDRGVRITTGFTPLLLALGVGSLVQAGRREVLQLTSLLLVALSFIYLGWADIAPSFDGDVWLARVIRVLMAMCVVAFLYAVVVLRKLDPAGDWFRAVRRAAATCATGAFVSLFVVLLLEAALYLEDPLAGAPINSAELIAVSVVWAGLVAALIALALRPARDPRALSETARMGYVYAAQAAAALLFAHLYLARPQWFGEELRQYWPYIVICIAFAGAAVGELFQRTGVRVLAEPLQRTGAFLPLLPAIGMWIVASRSDYSLLLFTAGLLYLFLSFTRQSIHAGFAAALAGNGALWSLLGEQGFELHRQPQLWMIPPAVSVLVAAELNRRRLMPQTLTALRYSSVLVIYLSSAGEMFLRGIGEQLWPPIVLLTLSVVGALLGVAMRIRAFLYLGSAFVFLSLVSMVWHAAQAIDHVWPWWAFGIGLSIAILILFGLFEKQRDRLAALANELRRWER